jgi:hypothetical protein
VTCAEARALFSALVDDELSPDDRAAANAHLAGCAECRRELERVSRTVSMVRALPPERAPAGFVDRVMTTVHPLPWPRRLARRLFVPVGVKIPVEVAAVVMVATTALWVFQRTPELQQAARQEAPAPPVATPPPSPSTPSSDTVGPARSGLKDAARAPAAPEPTPPVAREPAAEAKEKSERADTIQPREMETRRAEGDTLGGAAASRAPQAPTPARENLAKQAAPRLSARAGQADVAATWRVADRASAARELDALVTRLGGSPVTRGSEGDTETADFSVPREAYDELARALAGIGTLTPLPASGTLPPTVRVSLRITS